jgi:UDP-glucuronate decarboxylase
VTGGAGFLGSHLTDRLLEQGHEVICVDNLFTGTKRNIEHLHSHPRFEFMRHDVTFPLYVEVDEIYNLACPGLADPLPARPGADDQDLRAWRDQHAGPRQAPEMQDLPGLDQRGLRRSVVHPQTEDYWGNVNPVGPRSCYDEGKRCAETLFFDYWRQHGLEIKVARIFNTYGPRVHPPTAAWCRTSSCRP